MLPELKLGQSITSNRKTSLHKSSMNIYSLVGELLVSEVQTQHVQRVFLSHASICNLNSCYHQMPQGAPCSSSHQDLAECRSMAHVPVDCRQLASCNAITAHSSSLAHTVWCFHCRQEAPWQVCGLLGAHANNLGHKAQ